MSGFQIVGLPDFIQNPDHLQPNLFLTIQNPEKSGFQIPAVVNFSPEFRSFDLERCYLVHGLVNNPFDYSTSFPY